MTHKDIYTKFMIEYDKANVTSSYPSLTEYEVATVLDKAYHALIALKVTGNNVRRVALEGDLKAITDIQGLVKTSQLTLTDTNNDEYTNVEKTTLPSDYLYFISGSIFAPNEHKKFEKNGINIRTLDIRDVALDEKSNRKVIVKLVNHQIAEGFMASASNIPWVKTPVAFVEGDQIYIVVDPLKDYDNKFNITYIKTPNKFVKPISGDKDDIERYFNISDDTSYDYINKLSYFEYKLENDWSSYDRDLEKNISDKYTFECNDTVAEELISLAVAFALENVESQRLNSKLNMRGLEA